MRDFDDTVALVVGAGRRDGIGFATARQLAERGATLVLADMARSDVSELARELPHAELHAWEEVDVTSQTSMESCIESVLTRHGRIDAGYLGSAILKNQPFLDVPLSDWKSAIEVNLTGMFIAGQALARSMKQAGGRILCVASNAGRVPRLHNAAYGASKAGVIHLMRCMALELAAHRITVNALCPGSTQTSMAVANKSEGNPELVRNLIEGNLAEWRTGIPLGRLAEVDDQAAAAAFLLSPSAKHITGQALCVDGGQTFC